MLIYTKKGSSDKTDINITTSAGFQQSDYTKKQFQQKHSAEFSQGIKNFSYVIGGNYMTQDDYLPKGSIKGGGVLQISIIPSGKFKFVLSNNYNINNIISPTYPVFDTITGVGDFFAFHKDSAYVKDTYRIQSGTVSLNTFSSQQLVDAQPRVGL